MADLKRVLVLCTGNSCRSQMVEGYINVLGGGKFQGFSAGTKPSKLHPDAVTAMMEDGIDISGGKSESLDAYADQKFDHVITVCDDAAENCPVFPGSGNRLHWPFDDPADATGTDEQRLEIFRRVRDEIAARVEQFVGKHP